MSAISALKMKSPVKATTTSNGKIYKLDEFVPCQRSNYRCIN